MTFKEAVQNTPVLKDAFQEGLRALRAEDRPHIEAEDTRAIVGSVDIDLAMRRADPQGNRWDFAIGYKHGNRPEDVIYFVELHTANDAQVKKVLKKATWLHAWLKSDGMRFLPFERDIVWVSSGATTFTLSAPQRKGMAALGLRPCGRVLRIPNRR